MPNIHLDKIQKLQNRALRIVDLAPRYTSNLDLHKKYKVSPLFIRRSNNLLKLIHTYLRHNLDESNTAWDIGPNSTDINHRVLTRQTRTPYIPLTIPRTVKYKLSCAYAGPKLWLDQPLALRQIADRDEFKMRLKLRAREELPQLLNVFR